MTHLMIYGATGYPGRMAAALASAAGIPSRVAQPRKISIALHVSGAMSRASAISASQNLTTRARAAGARIDRNADGTDVRALLDTANGYS